ncbi:MAG TPA: glycosyltransferase family 2 protein, partial [Ktedonobacteraceae bacterium]
MSSSSIHRRVDISLVIPTYNERENIEILIPEVYTVLKATGRTFEIIVVDDDSPDGTWHVVQEMIRAYPGLHVLRRTQERGLARAVLRGWQEAQGEILAVMDGDRQHPPETLALLLEALEKQGGDIAVASRHIRGGGVSEWNMVRRGISWGATLAASWILPGTLATVRDPMSGYFALRRSVIEGCTLKPEGYKILLEVLGRGDYRAVVEVPYIFIERQQGRSKLGLRQYREFITHLLCLAWETRELQRLAKYCLVGTLGVIMNMGVLALLARAGMAYLQAGALAVETAIGTNFLLNELWSFADHARRHRGVIPRLARFLKFNVFCAGGATLSLITLWLLTEYVGFHYLLSNLVGITIATAWNYGMNANLTWESARAAHK